MAKGVSAKYWTGVLYPENMRDDWQDVIGDVLGVPYAYCVHDKDTLAGYQPKSDEDHMRKTHVHIVIAYTNTTTYNTVLKLFDKFSVATNKPCVNKVEVVNNIRHIYEYLIHNTETCKKQKKYLYDVSERITGNNFDVGAFEQLSMQEKNEMAKALCDEIVKQGFCNFVDFYMHVVSNYDSNYFEILKTYSGLFERLTKGNYQKAVAHRDYEKVLGNK